MQIMASNNNDSMEFNINNLSSDPKYDFTNVFKSDSPNKLFSFDTDITSPYDDLNFDCSYISALNCPVPSKNDLTIISLNVQSLNAKFNDLKDLISELERNNVMPDIICLQELWQFPNEMIFKIKGYQPLIYKLRSGNTQGGGVGILVKIGIDFTVDTGLSIFHDRILETIFIEINTSYSKYIIGSVYRPGNHPTLSTTDQYDLFAELLYNLLNDLTDRNLTSFIHGDFNLDCLKYGSCQLATNYIDLLFSHGFLQTVSKPTRCTLNSATLIDHCLTNANNLSLKSFIITSIISDHFPILHYASVINKQKKLLNTSNSAVFPRLTFADLLRTLAL